MAFSNKRYIIFAGANGVGKSTLYNLHPEYKRMHRVNVDELARRYGSWDDNSVQLKAGRKAVELLNLYLDSDEDFNQETTLCGRSILKNIKKAKKNGFQIEIHYIGVESPDVCNERIKHRIETGGHGIPNSDVNRRYFESLRNIKSIMNLCDKVFLYDNTDEFRLVAIYSDDLIDICTNDIPEWFKTYLL